MNDSENPEKLRLWRFKLDYTLEKVVDMLHEAGVVCTISSLWHYEQARRIPKKKELRLAIHKITRGKVPADGWRVFKPRSTQS